MRELGLKAATKLPSTTLSFIGKLAFTALLSVGYLIIAADWVNANTPIEGASTLLRITAFAMGFFIFMAAFVVASRLEQYFLFALSGITLIRMFSSLVLKYPELADKLMESVGTDGKGTLTINKLETEEYDINLEVKDENK